MIGRKTESVSERVKVRKYERVKCHISNFRSVDFMRSQYCSRSCEIPEDLVKYQTILHFNQSVL